MPDTTSSPFHPDFKETEPRIEDNEIVAVFNHPSIRWNDDDKLVKAAAQSANHYFANQGWIGRTTGIRPQARPFTSIFPAC